MSDHDLGDEQAYQAPDEHTVLRAYFAARAQDVQPSPELARRVAAIRPATGHRLLSRRASALALGGVALAGAAAFVLLAGQLSPGTDRPSPLAPPGTSGPPTRQPAASTPATVPGTGPSTGPGNGRGAGPATAIPVITPDPDPSAPPVPPSGSVPTSRVSPPAAPGSPDPSSPGPNSPDPNPVGPTPAGPDSPPTSASAPTPVVPSIRLAPPTMSGH